MGFRSRGVVLCSAGRRDRSPVVTAVVCLSGMSLQGIGMFPELGEEDGVLRRVFEMVVGKGAGPYLEVSRDRGLVLLVEDLLSRRG